PERYRAPLILCYFQGKTHEQAARDLGWPKSSLSSRLVRARELLGQGLRRRGVGVSAGILASALARPGEGAVSARLTIGTVRVAALLSGGKTMAPGMVSERALGLAQEAVKAASNAKLKAGALLLVIAAV